MSSRRKVERGTLTALPAWWAALGALAAREGCTRSEVVRRAVRAYVLALGGGK